MSGRGFHRTLAALVLAAALGMISARPAAAADLGLFGQAWQWLSGFWVEEITGWSFGVSTPAEGSGLSSVTAKHGWALDPNGFDSQAASDATADPRTQPTTPLYVDPDADTH